MMEFAPGAAGMVEGLVAAPLEDGLRLAGGSELAVGLASGYTLAVAAHTLHRAREEARRDASTASPRPAEARRGTRP